MGIIKGFIKGTIWEGSGNSRIMFPAPNIMAATLTYSGEMVTTSSFSEQGILGATSACLQSEAVTISLEQSDISWSMLKAATLSDAVARTKPVMVSEIILASQVTGTPAVTTVTLQHTPVVTPADLTEAGLPSSGLSVATVDGVNLTGTLTGSLATLDEDITGKQVVVQYLRAPLSGEETIYLGQGERRQTVGVYGIFFGCPGQLLVVAPKCAVNPNLNFGVSEGNTATATMELMVLRNNGYFVEITQLKDCDNC